MYGHLFFLFSIDLLEVAKKRAFKRENYLLPSQGSSMALNKNRVAKINELLLRDEAIDEAHFALSKNNRVVYNTREEQILQTSVLF